MFSVQQTFYVFNDMVSGSVYTVSMTERLEMNWTGCGRKRS